MLPQSESGSERGVTRSGVSERTITLTNGANQTQDLASLNRDTSNLNETVNRTPDLQNLLNDQSRLMAAATAAGEAVARDIGTYADKKRDAAQKLLATLLAYQAHCALSDFRGKLAWLLVHCSILSRVGASTKSGAIHGAHGWLAGASQGANSDLVSYGSSPKVGDFRVGSSVSASAMLGPLAGQFGGGAGLFSNIQGTPITGGYWQTKGVAAIGPNVGVGAEIKFNIIEFTYKGR
ncbi:hypothetical protein X636_01990 [Pandoraea pnomenusa]|nr:hypothetical protein X636_01990 [Pandoraea pnomenusa]